MEIYNNYKSRLVLDFVTLAVLILISAIFFFIVGQIFQNDPNAIYIKAGMGIVFVLLVLQLVIKLQQTKKDFKNIKTFTGSVIHKGYRYQRLLDNYLVSFDKGPMWIFGVNKQIFDTINQNDQVEVKYLESNKIILSIKK